MKKVKAITLANSNTKRIKKLIILPVLSYCPYIGLNICLNIIDKAKLLLVFLIPCKEYSIILFNP